MTDELKSSNSTKHKVEIPVQDKLALSVPEAMAISGIGRTLIYDEIIAGRLVARKVGNKTLILQPDLLAWLDSLPRGLEPEKPWLKEAKQNRRSASHEVTV